MGIAMVSEKRQSYGVFYFLIKHSVKFKKRKETFSKVFKLENFSFLFLKFSLEQCKYNFNVLIKRKVLVKSLFTRFYF